MGVAMHAIDLHLQTLSQLFESLDPAPFHEKALDRDAETWLLDCAGELPARAPFTIVVHGGAAIGASLDAIRSALRAHFELQHRTVLRRHRRRMRTGRIALAAGLAVLTLTLVLRRTLEATLGGGIADIAAEGLLVLGWVALWRPVDAVLFESWEWRQQRALLMRLATAPVAFRLAATAGEPSRPSSRERDAARV